MSSPLRASHACWLFCCAALATSFGQATADDAAAAKSVPPAVTVELWALEVAVDKLRGFGIDENSPLGLPAGGLSELLASTDKARQFEDRAPGGLVALFPYLKSKGLARVVAHLKLIVPSGQTGTIQTDDLKFEATSLVQDSGRIRVAYQVHHTEPLPPARRKLALGTKIPPETRTVDYSGLMVELDPGKTTLALGTDGWVALGPEPPTSLPIVFICASSAASSEPTATAAIVSTQAAPAADQPAPALQALTIKLKVVAVNSDKLKQLGYKWSPGAPPGDKQFSAEPFVLLSKGKPIPTDQLEGVLESLHQKGLVRIIADPTLVTLDGRPASLHLGTAQVDMVPHLLPSGRVKFECRLKTAESAERTVDTELELGKTGLLRNTPIDPRVAPRPPETETLILARVDLLKPGQTSKTAGRPGKGAARGLAR